MPRKKKKKSAEAEEDDNLVIRKRRRVSRRSRSQNRRKNFASEAISPTDADDEEEPPKLEEVLPDNDTDTETDDESEDSSDEEEECASGDEDGLHGPCNSTPPNCGMNMWECLIDKFIAKEFLPARGDLMELYTGVIEDYDQTNDVCVIKYSDNTIEKVNRKEALQLIEFFEY